MFFKELEVLIVNSGKPSKTQFSPMKSSTSNREFIYFSSSCNFLIFASVDNQLWVLKVSNYN